MKDKDIIKLSDIKLNPHNPRRISEKDMNKLCNSLEAFTKMLKYRPIIYDSSKTIVGGNMRFLALKKLGYDEVPSEWLRCADDFTEEEKRQFIIVDNGKFGEWDMDILANEWSDFPIIDWGVDLPTEWVNPIPENNTVIDEEAMKQTKNECPSCGFKW